MIITKLSPISFWFLAPMTWFLATFGMIGVLNHHVGIVVNDSNSLSTKVFLHFKTLSPSLGSTTMVSTPILGRNIIKQIVGVAGDILSYDKNGVLYLNNKVIGKPMRQPIPAQIIPKGEVFLYSPHEQSFDSRYQKLGLIAKRSCQGCLVPLW